jgi:predicted nucleic acid-binding protein
MRLADASAWIAFLIGSSLGQALTQDRPGRTEWLMPTMVPLELAEWLTRVVGEDRADRVIAFRETCVNADLDTPIARSAAILCATHKRATTDAVIYATTLAQDANPLTCDRRFGGLPRMHYRPKPGA